MCTQANVEWFDKLGQTRVLSCNKTPNAGFIYRVFLYSGPSYFTKSQAHYKFLYLENFRGGPVQIIQSLGLSQI